MAVFVTGAGGFLGQSLVNALLAEGEKVLAFDYNEPPAAALSAWKGGAEFHKGDIRDQKLIADLAAKSGAGDPIIHLAGILTTACDRDPHAALSVNVGGTYNVLEAARRNGGRRVVFASTVSVYGRGLPQPITEDMPTEADGWYGVSKQMAEAAGLLYARRYNADFRALRFAAVTGAGRVAAGSASLFTSLIPEKAAKGEPYEIEVPPDTSYPVVYIKDAVDAIVKTAYAKEAKSRIYNIASGNIIVDQMVSYVKKACPEAAFTFAPSREIMAVVAGFKEWVIDCKRAAREIGWEPSYSVEKMSDDIIAITKSKGGKQ